MRLVFILIISLFIQAFSQTCENKYFMVYKSKCCENPFFEENSGECFVANEQQSQPLSPQLFTDIKTVGGLKMVYPFIIFNVMINDNHVKIAASNRDFCAIKDLSPGHISLDKSFAEKVKSPLNSSMSVKGKSFVIQQFADRNKKPIKADIYMLEDDATALLKSMSGVKIDNLMNVILVKTECTTDVAKVEKELQKIVGNSAKVSTEFTSCCASACN